MFFLNPIPKYQLESAFLSFFFLNRAVKYLMSTLRSISRKQELLTGDKWCEVVTSVFEASGSFRLGLFSVSVASINEEYFYTPWMGYYSPSQGYPQPFIGTHLYSWVERATASVKCMHCESKVCCQKTQHNDTKARTQTAWSLVQTTRPPPSIWRGAK